MIKVGQQRNSWFLEPAKHLLCHFEGTYENKHCKEKHKYSIANSVPKNTALQINSTMRRKPFKALQSRPGPPDYYTNSWPCTTYSKPLYASFLRLLLTAPSLGKYSCKTVWIGRCISTKVWMIKPANYLHLQAEQLLWVVSDSLRKT